VNFRVLQETNATLSYNILLFWLKKRKRCDVIRFLVYDRTKKSERRNMYAIYTYSPWANVKHY